MKSEIRNGNNKTNIIFEIKIITKQITKIQYYQGNTDGQLWNS